MWEEGRLLGIGPSWTPGWLRPPSSCRRDDSSLPRRSAGSLGGATARVRSASLRHACFAYGLQREGLELVGKNF